MAKKDFSSKQNPVTNPALRFITGAAPAEVVAEVVAEVPVQEVPVAAPAPVKKAERPKKPTAERKTRRLNLLLQPSVLEDVSKIATMRRTSVNDLINEVLRAYAKKNADVIRTHDEVFGE